VQVKAEHLKVSLFIEVPLDAVDSAIPLNVAVQAAFENFIRDRGWFIHSFGTRPDTTFAEKKEQS
jgi:hypothetical protein